MFSWFFKSCQQLTFSLTIEANSNILAYGAGDVLLFISSSSNSRPPSLSINRQYLAGMIWKIFKNNNLKALIFFKKLSSKCLEAFQKPQ